MARRMKIQDFNSTPITNHLQRLEGGLDAYTDWLSKASMEGSAVQVAKNHLGRQNHCWTGGSGNHRHFVWVRTTNISLIHGGWGRVRLFASKRGLQLEVEWGTIPSEALRVLHEFIRMWEV